MSAQRLQRGISSVLFVVLFSVLIVVLQRRENWFFKKTLHDIDEFHTKDHTKCSECFRLNKYKVTGSPFQYLNCSACETGNSLLGPLRKSARKMRQETLMEVARLKLELQNRFRIRALQKNASQVGDVREEFDPILFVDNLPEAHAQ
jgi:hypothetical protein